jgi:peptidoglycan/LPS O-acetylase OafA/YrhL
MRYSALQGIRGLAALFVLLSHLVPTELGEEVSAYRILPLAAGWLAGHGVWAFFVLSGFVLAHLFEKGLPDYGAYLTSRVARLILPVLFAVLLMLGAAAIFNFQDIPDILASRFKNDLGNSLFAEISLTSSSGFLLGPLWSLRWELLFSVALWGFIFIARRTSGWLGLGISVALSIAGYLLHLEALMYLPMFMVGVVLKLNPNLRLDFRAREVLALGVSGIILGATFVLKILDGAGPLSGSLDLAVSMYFIGLIITLSTQKSFTQRLFSSKIPYELGTISYSLYLCHIPVIYSLGQLAINNIWIQLIASITLAIVMYNVIEKPAHRLSQRLRKIELA